MTNSQTLSLVSLAVLSTFALGCASKKDASSDDSTADGAESASLEGDVESVGTSFVADNGTSVGLSSFGEGATQGSGLHLSGLGDGAKSFYRNPACVTVTKDDAAKKVTYVLNGCTGPLGLVSVGGTVVADYSASTLTELRVTFTGTGLKVNRATVDWTATAKVTWAGVHRTMVWDGNITGTTWNGRTAHRENHKTIEWDKGVQCLTVNGSSTGNIAGREHTTTIENFKRCADACPEAGGKITVTGPKGGSVSIVIEAGGKALVTASTGASAEITLPCAL